MDRRTTFQPSAAKPTSFALSPDRIRLGGSELVATTLTSCLLGGGSLVLVESTDDLATIAAQEGAVDV